MDNLEEYDEEPEESKLKKVFVIAISIILLLLFLFYLFITPLGDKIISLISSEKAQENQIDFSFNNKLIFLNNSLEQLKKIYLSNQRVEFKACLKGNKLDNTYFVNSLYIPKTFSQKFNQVVSEPCSSDSLVSLHSHPYKSCSPSQQDFNSFNEFKKQNKEALMIIMCEPNRFSIHE